MALAAGSYRVEWFNINSRQIVEADQVMVTRDESRHFIPLFAEAGPVVSYLKQVSG